MEQSKAMKDFALLFIVFQLNASALMLYLYRRSRRTRRVQNALRAYLRRPAC